MYHVLTWFRSRRMNRLEGGNSRLNSAQLLPPPQGPPRASTVPLQSSTSNDMLTMAAPFRVGRRSVRPDRTS